ncbi:MAG: helix-turn-helix domain-containing protein [Acidobacteriota bacterium]
MPDPTEVFFRILTSLEAKNAPEAARKLGISKQAVYEWQKTTPGLENLLKIAESSGTSLHWLLTGKGEQYLNQPSKVGFEEIMDSKIRAIVREEIAASSKLIQDLGTIDQFLADSIRRHDDPSLVLQEWWKREGWPDEELAVPDFADWDKMTLKEKIDDIKEFRDELVRHIERDEILTSKTPGAAE